ncbi:MAG: PH domain-containing protein [Deltaproteobacteria bacterium]|jgi:hypothetical protein|nr:PH domain-containing protein [Deltaproteobacteria bacterium]
MFFLSSQLDQEIIDNAYFGWLGAFGLTSTLKHLPDLLLKDESFLAITRGRVDGIPWVLAVTGLRIILLNKGFFAGYRHLEVPFPMIRSVSSRIGWIWGSIYIDTGSGTVVLNHISKKNTHQIVAIISQVLNSAKESNQAPASAQAPQALSLATSQALAAASELTNQLEKLASLRDRGVLTEAEFLIQKRKILSKTDSMAIVKDPPRKLEVLPEVKPSPKPVEIAPDPPGSIKKLKSLVSTRPQIRENSTKAPPNRPPEVKEPPKNKKNI